MTCILLDWGMTSEPLCETKCLNLWKYLWLYHLSVKMFLVSSDMIILLPGQAFTFCAIGVFERIC